MPSRRNLVDIESDARIRLENNTPVTNFTPTGTVANLVNMMAAEGERIYDELEYLHAIHDPTRTFGVELDNIGFIVGRVRGGATTATDLTNTNVYFFLDPRVGLGIGSLITKLYPTNTHFARKRVLQEQGYIDDAANPTRLIIPVGTLITNSDTTITYQTLEDVEITNDNSEAYVPVISSSSGPEFNVEANTLVRHSLNNISALKDLSKYILCSNRYPINNGSSTELDEEYRYRVSLASQSIQGNEVSIRETTLNIPGVRDITYQRGRYGNGTVNIVVEGISPIVSEGLLEIVRQQVALTATGGERIFVTRPDYRGVELNFELIVDAGANRDIIREEVRSNIISFINDIPVGGRIIWNQLEALIVTRPGVEDFILNYFKIGDYDIFSKTNKNQVVLRPRNQRTRTEEKFYTDAGLVSICCR